MTGLTEEFVTAIARVWHRIQLRPRDAEKLAQMLAPMDEAGEDMAESVEFDMEPSDFQRGLDAMRGASDNK